MSSISNNITIYASGSLTINLSPSSPSILTPTAATPLPIPTTPVRSSSGPLRRSARHIKKPTRHSPEEPKSRPLQNRTRAKSAATSAIPSPCQPEEIQLDARKKVRLQEIIAEVELGDVELEVASSLVSLLDILPPDPKANWSKAMLSENLQVGKTNHYYFFAGQNFEVNHNLIKFSKVIEEKLALGTTECLESLAVVESLACATIRYRSFIYFAEKMYPKISEKLKEISQTEKFLEFDNYIESKKKFFYEKNKIELAKQILPNYSISSDPVKAFREGRVDYKVNAINKLAEFARQHFNVASGSLDKKVLENIRMALVANEVILRIQNTNPRGYIGTAACSRRMLEFSIKSEPERQYITKKALNAEAYSLMVINPNNEKLTEAEKKRNYIIITSDQLTRRGDVLNLIQFIDFQNKKRSAETL